MHVDFDGIGETVMVTTIIMLNVQGSSIWEPVEALLDLGNREEKPNT